MSCRHRRNTPGRQVVNPYSRMVMRFAYVQDRQRWTEWSFRLISQRQAERLYAAGEVERISREKDGVVQVVGYKDLKAARSGSPTACSLTPASMNALTNDGDLDFRDCAELVRVRIWPLMKPTMNVADWDRVEAQVGRLG